MKLSTAIKHASKKSALNRFGNQYQIIYYHKGYTTNSNSMDYFLARQCRARDVVTQALVLMGYDEYDAGYACYDLTGSIEDMAREGLERVK